MLEYFTFKKVKKHRDDKTAEKQKNSEEKGKEGSKTTTAKEFDDDAAVTPTSPIIISKPADHDQISVEGATPILDHEDEKFLEHLASGHASVVRSGEGDDEGPPPPLPPRVKTPVIEIDSDDASSVLSSNKKEDKKAAGEDKTADANVKKGKGKEKEKESETKEKDKSKRFSFVTNISRNISLRRKPATASPSTSKPDLHPDPDHLAVPSPASAEAEREHTEMARVLDDLDLSARNNRVFSLSAESADMVRRFTQVLRDLVNGVPTAYGDLVGLLDDRDGALARGYERLPKSLKKLVAQLPEKLTSTLAPELLAVAAEAQGLEATTSTAEMAGKAGLTEAAKKFFAPGNLHDLVTRPGALAGLLRGIVNALKARFPAFIGTNVLWSLAVFLLLSMLWYCYKRGREVRLEREASEAAEAAAAAAVTNDDDEKNNDMIDGKARVEELPDDPMLLAGPGPSSTAPAGVAPPASTAPEAGAKRDTA